MEANSNMDLMVAKASAVTRTKDDDRGMYALIEKLATDPAADVEKLRTVVDLYNQQQDRFAREEFERAFAAMQPELPVVAKTHYNEQTRSKYAKLEDIQRVVKPILKEYGFSTRYESPEQQPEGHVAVTCILTHRNGHSVRNTVVLSIDNKGIKGADNKTETHGTGSSLSYARRYALCGILDIATGDDDGNAAGGQPRISHIQQRILMELYEEAPRHAQEAFTKVFPDFKEVPVAKYQAVMDRFKDEIAKANAGGAA